MQATRVCRDSRPTLDGGRRCSEVWPHNCSCSLSYAWQCTIDYLTITVDRRFIDLDSATRSVQSSWLLLLFSLFHLCSSVWVLGDLMYL
ncbi:hypothetical protein BV25DRAFT_1168378 [Artomyces pyxidatus]|uniref:Uncharacterized protein n=1 Tax=Artomyces pyxidatus TaxID=48021 RepID=A0ACB8SR81_9AGAM|nr:hypothetical protein BV25DRAFT_1168378 [Artomyces pyxidatus]